MSAPKEIWFCNHRYVQASSLIRKQSAVLKTGTKINIVHIDPTLDKEVRLWCVNQLRKKRKVYRDINERVDFVLFSTDLSSMETFETILPKRFKYYRNHPPKLQEITDPAQSVARIEPDLPSPIIEDHGPAVPSGPPHVVKEIK